MSYLTVSRPEAPISSLEEFIANEDWTLVMEEGYGSVGDWARNSTPARRDLYRLITERSRFAPLDGTVENMLRATQPRTLVLYDLKLIFHRVGSEACRLVQLPSEELPEEWTVPEYLVLRKGLGHLRDRMNHVLQRLLQSGAVDRLRRRWFGHGRRLCAAVAAVRPLTLADLAAVLAVTPLAAAAGCLLLGVELMVRRLSRRRDQQRRQGTADSAARGRAGAAAGAARARRARSLPSIFSCCERQLNTKC
ncbi:uncharacterized protein LOC122393559 [Amphibalanus amphitrite]|uniref:uncharacterized protein LOC122393559 n=1 Tax=Amphibalanus amphitrite TaxID=1232801 RepID=UPI001C907645|nr:uncharacterized protein LOC122393559 [Amphibalanus amphitrite]